MRAALNNDFTQLYATTARARKKNIGTAIFPYAASRNTMGRQPLEPKDLPVGQPFFAVWGGKIWKAQEVITLDIAGNEARRLNLKGITDNSEWLIVSERIFSPIIERFSQCRSYDDLCEDDGSMKAEYIEKS